jgi:hypothetical protein
MGQETELWEQETHRETENRADRLKDESKTGRDIPGGDGGVGDEQVNAIDDDGSGRPTGQDHSTDHHEIEASRDGVGAIQDSSDTRSDIADISD